MEEKIEELETKLNALITVVRMEIAKTEIMMSLISSLEAESGLVIKAVDVLISDLNILSKSIENLKKPIEPSSN